MGFLTEIHTTNKARQIDADGEHNRRHEQTEHAAEQAGFPATSSQQNDPDGTMYNPSTATNLITLYWWHLFYDYSSSPRQIRLTGKRAAIRPRRQNWPWPLARWCRICPYANQCPWHPQAQIQNFPQLLPPWRKFLPTETKTASFGFGNSVGFNIFTEGILITKI